MVKFIVKIVLLFPINYFPKQNILKY